MPWDHRLHAEPVHTKKLGPHRTGHCLMATGARTRRLLASVIEITFSSVESGINAASLFSDYIFLKFLVSHCNFLFIPCGRLSWLYPSALYCTLSYRIVLSSESISNGRVSISYFCDGKKLLGSARMHVHLYLLFYFILAFRVLYTVIMTNKLYYIHFAMTIT